MIRLTLQDGRTFDLEEETELTVGDEKFRAGDVLQIWLQEVSMSMLQGRVAGTGKRLRGLRFIDAATGISTIVALEAEEARAMAETLLQPQILIPGE